MSKVLVIGLMSGSSMDGLDLCAVSFEGSNFEILASQAIDIDPDIKLALVGSRELPEAELLQLDHRYGAYCGDQLAAFIHSKQLPNPDLAVLHGHTVYHYPKRGVTKQIGHGSSVARRSGIPCITELRAEDMKAGGQGAPIVPLGERDLFPDQHAFLNLGGICNISIRDAQDVIQAWDIAPANQVLNALAQELGFEYDAAGELARTGSIHQQGMVDIEDLDYFRSDPPKSLDNGFSREVILPLIHSWEISIEDALATYTGFLARTIAHLMNHNQMTQLMCTGGGTHNQFLIESIQAQTTAKLFIPSKEIIDFKEALIMAYLGLLRSQNRPNVLASVTGATHDTMNGTVYLP